MADDIHQYTQGQGLYLLSFFESAGEVSPVFEKKARELFSEYGLEDVEPEEFYPGDKISDAFFDVVNDVGDKTMQKGGKQMGLDVPWPEGVDDPHAGLQTIDAVHQEAARTTDDAPADLERPAGGYTYEQTGDTSAHVGITENYPYPSVMAEGVFLGIVNGLGASSATITDDTPKGDEKSAWEISW
jgi:hypothetical protein